MKIGKTLKNIRKCNNISQNKLAVLSGINRGYLYKLETDQISPSVNTLEKICRVIGVKLSELFRSAEENDSEDKKHS